MKQLLIMLASCTALGGCMATLGPAVDEPTVYVTPSVPAVIAPLPAQVHVVAFNPAPRRPLVISPRPHVIAARPHVIAPRPHQGHALRPLAPSGHNPHPKGKVVPHPPAQPHPQVGGTQPKPVQPRVGGTHFKQAQPRPAGGKQQPAQPRASRNHQPTARR